MALKSLIIKGKEYPVNKITKLVMKDGKVCMWYLPSAMGGEEEIVARFKDVEFVNKDGG